MDSFLPFVVAKNFKEVFSTRIKSLQRGKRYVIILELCQIVPKGADEYSHAEKKRNTKQNAEFYKRKLLFFNFN